MPQESTRRVISRNVNKTDEILSTDNKQGPSKHHQNEEKSTDLTSFTNKTPYNEDIELEETNIDQNYIWKELVTDKFRNVLESIKIIQNAPLMDKYELDQNYKKGLLMCATLKKLNRVSHLRINKARLKSNEEKNKVDEHHLELQNLLYEISHIQKEVNKCLEFRSLDEDINLVSVDEFYKHAPIEISKPEVTSKDAHKLKLARLDWELNERKVMKAKIKSLECSIEKYQNECKEKHEKLESFNPRLNKIIDACKPTLEFLKMNFDDDCNIGDSVQLLPKPLYTLYMLMISYRDTTDKTVKVEVIGDIESAKRFDSNEQIIMDEDESAGDSAGEDDGDNENYKPKKKSKVNKSTAAKAKRDKVFTPYPLSVKINLTVKNCGQIILNLNYFNFLKIVTVKSELLFEKDNFNSSENSLLRSDSIFDCLYENDRGRESPNLSNKFLFSSIGVKSIESYTKTIGYPYKWCQILCGLYYINESDVKHKEVISKVDEMDEDEIDEIDGDIFTYAATNSNKNEAKILPKVLHNLKSRFKSRLTLQETINSLKKCIVPTISSIRQITAKIISFKEINYEKLLASNYADHLISLISEDDSFFYEMNLVNGNAKLQALIVINQDYPLTSPLFALNVNWKTDRNFKNDETIRDIEREINICKDDYIDNNEVNKKRFKQMAASINNYDLLIKQINHLIVCFDIYLESESYFLKNDEFPRYKFFLNSVRGKDRKRPYSYLTSRDIFVQRLNYDNNISNC